MAQRVNSAGATQLSAELRSLVAGVSPPILSLASGVYAGSRMVSITGVDPKAAVYYTTDGTTPTTSSKLYGGPIALTKTERITAVAVLDGVSSAIATAAYTIASGTPVSVIDLSGFTEGSMQFNGSAKVDGERLQLTDGGMQESGSAFYATAVNIQSFTTYFTFQLRDAIADGFTFAIQNTGDKALGDAGKALGYAPIGVSVAVKFDLHNNAGEGPNSTGIYVDGALPTVPSVDLSGTGIDLHKGDSILAQITYDGKDLSLTLTDSVTLASWSYSFAIDIPTTVGASTAYAGFTGGTGGGTANQEILSWTYVSGTPGTLPPPPPIPPLPDYPNGINSVGLRTNGSAGLFGNSLRLTNGGKTEAGSAFYATPLTVDQSFTTDFTFRLSSPDASVPLSEIADGFTFIILDAEPYVSVGTSALGDAGGSLGFAGIPHNGAGGYDNYDMVIKFDLHNNAGEGSNSTGLYVNGALPTVPAIDLTGTGIDLHSGHPIRAHLVHDYTAKTLAITLTDTITSETWSHSFAVDIPKTIGSVIAFVGFTGATGGNVAVQDILDWTLTTP